MAKNTVVAIPAKDEGERIGSCLSALDRQTHRPDAVVLMINNSRDATQTIARAMAPWLGFQLAVVCQDFPPAQANAGHARRLAMQVAASMAAPDGILLTTDADAVTPPDWVSRNVLAVRQGADIVCGRAVIDPREAGLIPAHLHDDDARECRLIALLDELAWTLDPKPHDPLPRHTEASGASLAVSVKAFRFVGGIPATPSGEDRAFVRALWMADARVRHDPAIKVMVSGRVTGRAPGGMADTIRRRMVQQDEFTDDQVEPAVDAFRRYGLRYRARRVWMGSGDQPLARDLAVSRTKLAEAFTHRFFGRTWAELEASSPVLWRRRVRFTDVDTEIVAAQSLLEGLSAPEIMAAD